jgi:hypothetical protein
MASKVGTPSEDESPGASLEPIAVGLLSCPCVCVGRARLPPIVWSVVDDCALGLIRCLSGREMRPPIQILVSTPSEPAPVKLEVANA